MQDKTQRTAINQIHELESIAQRYAHEFENAGRETYGEDAEKAARKAKTKLTAALTDFLGKNTATGQCLHQIQEPAAAEQAAWHAGLDEGRAQAAPAAVAVVLPEPWGYLVEGRIFIGRLLPQHVNSMVESEGFQPIKLFTEQQLRALLATATGLPAQAVPAFCHVASLKLKSLQERGYQITGYALEKPVEGAQPERGFINHGGFVGWWWDGQSPQAQADARDAALAASEQDALRLVRQAVRDFHYALDNTKHGGVAAGAAMNAIELALNMYWQQGQEADRRAAIAAAKGE